MPTTRTYHVGLEGKSRRLDDLSGSWINIPIVISSNTVFWDLLDVKTDPNDGDKVIVVGQGKGTTYGIYVSTDAGLTWTQPGGNYNTNVVASESVWYEISYVDSNTIFVSGQKGYVAKSTDGGVTFNLTTQIPPVTSCSTCVPTVNEATSLHFIDSNRGVVGLIGRVAKTTDAGVTWTITPLVEDSPDLAVNITGIHLSSTGLVINVMSNTGLFRSTDGGNTWTATYPFTNNIGRHLTWTSDTQLWGFCVQDLIVKSIDAGINWTVVKPQNISGPEHYAGHFYQLQNGYFSTDNNLNYTNDGATTSVPSDVASGITIMAVWTWFYTPICYTLTPCEEGFSVYNVDNDFSQIVGNYIQLCPDNIPSNQVNNPTGYAWSLTQTNALNTYVLQDCCGDLADISVSGYNFTPFVTANAIVQIDQIPGKCWRVLKANSPTPPPYTLPATITGYAYANCITCQQNFACVPTPPLLECQCFRIELSTSCENVITLTGVDTIEGFDSCDSCIAQNNPPCYKLTDCEDEQHVIITGDDLSQYINQVIEIKSCPDYCFYVEEVRDCIGLIPVLPVTAAYPTCELCNPPVVEIPRLISRRVKPGYDTPACPPEYTEKVSCTFGEAMYNEVLVKRYGITDCCTIDATKWTIKKELLNLRVLLDPDFVTPPPVVCKCYDIKSISGEATFKYINCEGCLTTITLAEDDIKYICSQTYPKLSCPETNVTPVYIINSSGENCTKDNDCLPPPTCYCITFTNEEAIIAGVDLYTCENGNMGYVLENGQSVSVCGDPDSIVITSGPLTVNISTTTCTLNSECQA